MYTYIYMCVYIYMMNIWKHNLEIIDNGKENIIDIFYLMRFHI